ncbi:MAG: phosphate ABC transporter permease PstA [Candidatus Bathyarchaeota archaeon]|nr:phosphate ABC transporter permease PstA [Candidatus Bathyarchaeota archaeon]MDD4325401.1 phosphate ABC transporter permease PstA [Candidatus Bathyarchaeota archaeon]MDI9578189.1 phosphate ABC transporter permease PstA [Thermoproteota archaeon]
MHNYRFRKFKNYLFFVLCGLCALIAIIPLISILWEVIIRGAPQLSLDFITQTNSNGGIGPAIQGTFILIGLTSLFGVPIGILSGVYLSEFGDNKYAAALRSMNDVLTEVPSIVVGITAYGVIVIALIGSYSAIAGAVALSFILIPIVARTTEESLKLVPNSVREASLALGAHRWRTTLSVVLPTAKNGLVTGTLLAVARIAGETAPLIMTILGNRYFFQGLDQPMAALSLEIWRNSLQPQASLQAQGWGAALLLILLVLTLNIVVRLASRGRFKK